MIGGIKVLGDQGIIRATSTRATVMDREIGALVRHWGMMLNTRIKAKASGRPGPNAPTGDYRRSWGMPEFHQEGSTATSINGTNAPQAKRLEFGFVGVDSLGRNYNQPPYPHVGPAKDEIEPEFVKAVETYLRTL